VNTAPENLPEQSLSKTPFWRSNWWKSEQWQAILARAALGVIALVFLVVFPGEKPAPNSLDLRVNAEAKDVLFNYVGWEVSAVSAKFTQQFAGDAAYMDESQRSAYIVDYLQRVRQLQRVEAKITASFCRPSDNASSADLIAERDTLRRDVDARVSLAEAIIDEQVASILRDEGFGALGSIIPPVSAHITDLPTMLVISPRDKISYKSATSLINLQDDQQQALEANIDRNLRDQNIVSLVVPIGGLSLYPSMVEQTWYAPFVFEVAAHEWTHHYLMFFPLGLNYLSEGDSRTINETTASLMGKEITRKVIMRFYSTYPDIVAQLPPLETETPSAQPTKPPEFDYSKTMNETRVRVDQLLAKGKINEAEQYMESQRQVFNTHGYCIRKLNQAYFAFYGGYQSAQDTGAAGQDPIGPAIGAIRQHSPTVKSWLEIMRSITTRDELFSARDALTQ
jgi:hypothetical protein